MNLSPQKSKTIHDYRQHHGQADTEQTAPAEPAASPGCSRHQGLELGHPPNKWGLSLWIWGPEGCVVFTVSSHKFLMPPPPRYPALGNWKNEGRREVRWLG